MDNPSPVTALFNPWSFFSPTYMYGASHAMTGTSQPHVYILNATSTFFLHTPKPLTYNCKVRVMLTGDGHGKKEQ